MNNLQLICKNLFSLKIKKCKNIQKKYRECEENEM